jgi:hypothetical protein
LTYERKMCLHGYCCPASIRSCAFNDAVSNCRSTQPQMFRWLVKSTLERNGKEAVVTYLKILTQHMPLKTHRNHRNFGHVNRSPNRDLNRSLQKIQVRSITAKADVPRKYVPSC